MANHATSGESRRPASERQRPLLDRDRAGGRGVGAGRGTRAIRRRRHPRAQPRREIPRHARGGLSRLPVVAHRHPRAAEPGIDRRRQLEERVRRPSSASTGASTSRPARRWPAIAAAATNPSGTRSTARSCSRTPSATACAMPPASGPTSSRSAPTCCCICMWRGPRHCVSVDFSGESLHRRGYRSEGGRAPLKENVAAAVLLRAGWPSDLRTQAACCSIPMCGSGTFLTEGALDRCRCRAGARSRVFRLPGVARP